MMRFFVLCFMAHSKDLKCEMMRRYSSENTMDLDRALDGGTDGAKIAVVLDRHGWCEESSGFYQPTRQSGC